MAGKDLIRIRRKRLDRWFYGRFNEKFPSRESWTEGGHFIEGVSIDLNSVNQQDGIKRFGDNLGYLVNGEMEHAQSTLSDAQDYLSLNGVMNFAYLCFDQLYIYRAKLVPPNNTVQDNRISLQTSGPGYGETREKAISKISGLITQVEAYQVDPKTVVVVSGALQFKVLKQLRLIAR